MNILDKIEYVCGICGETHIGWCANTQIKEARKQAFLEAAEMVSSLEIGRTRSKLKQETFMYGGDVIKLLREKADEEC